MKVRIVNVVIYISGRSIVRKLFLMLSIRNDKEVMMYINCKVLYFRWVKISRI